MVNAMYIRDINVSDMKKHVQDSNANPTKILNLRMDRNAVRKC